MTNNTKALCKKLTQIRAATGQIVQDAEFDNSSAGLSRSAYLRGRGRKKHERMVRKVSRQISAARELSLSVDRCTVLAVDQIEAVTQQVIAECEHFPRGAEWAGRAPLTKQGALISEVRAQLRRSAP